MKMIKTKNLKPIDVDAHFKYRCPKCSCDHWVSYRQARTKHFKVVCDCDTVFEVKTIKTIKAIFIEEKTIQTETKTEIKPESSGPVVPAEVLEKCSKILIGYGFTEDESLNMIQKAYSLYPVNNDCATLIKMSIGNTLGDKK